MKWQMMLGTALAIRCQIGMIDEPLPEIPKCERHPHQSVPRHCEDCKIIAMMHEAVRLFNVFKESVEKLEKYDKK